MTAMATEAIAARRYSTPHPALHLTRRGRLVLVLTVMILAVVAGLTIGHGSSSAAGAGRPVQHRVVVQPGETLWTLADRIAPHLDPRLVVSDIETLNHLHGGLVEPGQQLLVPTT
jgi:LysM domain